MIEQHCQTAKANGYFLPNEEGLKAQTVSDYSSDALSRAAAKANGYFLANEEGLKAQTVSVQSLHGLERGTQRRRVQLLRMVSAWSQVRVLLAL